MELNLTLVHPDLQDHVQAIHDSMRTIMEASHLSTEDRRIALQETENLYDDAFDTLQNEDDNSEECEDDFDDEVDEDDEEEDDDEGAEEARDRYPEDDDMPEPGDFDDEEED